MPNGDGVKLLKPAQVLAGWLFAITYLLYGLHVSPGGGVNPNRYFDLTHSLVDYGVLHIDAYHENTVDKAFRDGHYYSAGFPGPSGLGIPAYLAFKVVYALTPEPWLAPVRQIQSFKQGATTGFYAQDTTAFFLSTIWLVWFTLAPLAAWSAVLMWQTLQRLGVAPRVALVSALVYALGTPIFFFSTVYFSHVFAAVFVVLALDLATRWPRPTALQLAGLGLAAGTPALMEAQGLLVAGLFGGYVLVRHGWRASVFYALGMAVPVGGLLLYNTIAFGGPLNWSYQYMVGANFESFHTQGYWGFTVPRPERLWGLTFSLERGLFLYAPALALAGWGWWLALRQRAAFTADVWFKWLTLTGFVAIFAYVASFEAWNGSVTFGPRLNVIAIPFIVVAMAWGLQALARHPVARWVTGGWVAVSLFNNWLGAQYGTVETAFGHWPTFWQSGPQIPALGVIVSHATSTNALVTFVLTWHWLIYSGYGLLLLGLGALLWWQARQLPREQETV